VNYNDRPYPLLSEEEKIFGTDMPMWYMTQKKKKVNQTQLMNTIFIIKIVLRVSACDSHFNAPSALIYFVRLKTFDRTSVDGESKEGKR